MSVTVKREDALPLRDARADDEEVAFTGSTGAALVVLSLATLMPSLSTSSANAALPILAKALDASFPAVQWIILAYLVAVTTLIVIVGRLGDLIGRRRLMLAGIAGFTIASLLGGLVSSLPLVIAARVVQGIGAAIMMTLSIAFIGDIIPKSRTGSAMGFIGATSAIGTTLGPSLGGILIVWFGWQSIFLVNVPLGIVAFALAWRTLPVSSASVRPQADGFDLPGMTLMALTLTAYALAMTIGGARPGATTVVLLILAAIGVVAFLVVESKARFPMIRIGLLRDRWLGGSLAMSVCVSTVMMSILIVGPFYIAHGLGLSPALVGLSLSAGPLVAALTGVPNGRLVDRFGSERASATGLVGIAIGAATFALLPTRFGIVGYIAPVVFMTASYALFQTANTAAVMAKSLPEERGVRSGMLGLARYMGLITGASAMGALFAFATGAADIMTATPAAIATGARTTFAVSVALMLLALTIARSIRRKACADPC